MPCTSSPLPLQPRYSQLIRQSRAVLHCVLPGLFAIKKERIPCWPRHCVDEWTGWRSEGKEDEEGEKDESRIRRDRVVDIVNGRERSRDSEKKIADEIKHSEFVAVVHHFVISASLHIAWLHPSVTWLWITLYNISFPRGSLIFFLSPGLFSFRHEIFSLIFLAAVPSSLLPIFHSGGRPVTRSYRDAMTRKWNVLSRAVIHLLYLTSPQRSPSPDTVGGFLGLNALYPRHLHPPGESRVSYGFLEIISIYATYTTTLSRLIKIRSKIRMEKLVITRRIIALSHGIDIFFRTPIFDRFSEMKTYAGGSRVAANNITCLATMTYPIRVWSWSGR